MWLTLALAIMTISESTFHPVLIILFNNDFNFYVFFIIVSFGIFFIKVCEFNELYC